MPRDAEAWLAERGVRRDPIHVAPPPAGGDGAGEVAGPPPPAAPPTPPGPDLSARDAARVAEQAAADADLEDADARATPDPAVRRLEDDIADAVAFIRRSTAMTPQAEGRVRQKLAERGFRPQVVDQALERARRERLVDDAAMATALVEERQRKGHAPARIRRDLRERGFDDAVLDAALQRAESQDLEAAAFAVANDKASRSTGLSPDAAFRRVAAHVARRGYPEALARKVAREAVFTAREDERTAGH